MEETSQTIYKLWFVDFEFPDESGKPYKSSGGKMLWNEELSKEIPLRCNIKPVKKYATKICSGGIPR